ncbi:hypothetical protein IGK38_002988 [Enterococcus pernyi]
MLTETNFLDINIILAYCKLLKSGKIPIKVSDITREANISRGTFYLHFKNIKFLNDHIESQVLNEVIIIWGTDHPPLNDNPVLMTKIEYFCQFISENKIIFSGLLLNKEQIHFKSSLNRCICNGLFGPRNITKENQKNKDTYYTEYVVVAMIEIIENWLQKPKPESPSDMAAILNYLLSHSLGKIHSDIK